MKALLAVIFSLAIGATAALPLAAAAAQVDASAVATRLLDHMEAGDFAAALAGFTPQMKGALGADKLAAVQQQINGAGAATGRDAPKLAQQSGMTVVVVRLHRANASLDATIAVDAEGRVAGLHYAPAPSPPAAAPAVDAPYLERETQVGEGPRALPATLAMPKAQLAAGKRVPAVVLVHGSGPQDRDQTIGPNRPFLDIARGLAAQGIAVLRYEKRSKARPQDFAAGDFTVDDETTNDAVAAVQSLRGVEGIDPARIFVLGHSQGGMMAPRIAQRSGQVAGLVMLAAPARSVLTLLAEQNRYLVSLDGSISAEEQAHLDQLDAQIAALRSGGDVAAADTPMGAPAGYWRSIDALDPVAEAKAVPLPLLLLQGGRDIQVVDADWQLWRKALAGNPRATFHYFAALNHLGISGSGPGSVAEYQTPGRVDAALINDIATWISAH